MTGIILLPEINSQEPTTQAGNGTKTDSAVGGIPSFDGRCTKEKCRATIFRLFDKTHGKILTPSCLACGTAYPLTPANLWLPLLMIGES